MTNCCATAFMAEFMEQDTMTVYCDLRYLIFELTGVLDVQTAVQWILSSETTASAQNARRLLAARVDFGERLSTRLNRGFVACYTALAAPRGTKRAVLEDLVGSLPYDWLDGRNELYEMLHTLTIRDWLRPFMTSYVPEINCPGVKLIKQRIEMVVVLLLNKWHSENRAQTFDEVITNHILLLLPSFESTPTQELYSRLIRGNFTKVFLYLINLQVPCCTLQWVILRSFTYNTSHDIIRAAFAGINLTSSSLHVMVMRGMFVTLRNLRRAGINISAIQLMSASLRAQYAPVWSSCFAKEICEISQEIKVCFGMSSLHCVIIYGKCEDILEIVDMCDCMILDEYKHTISHTLVANRIWQDVARLLPAFIKRGVNPNHTDVFGDNIAHLLMVSLAHGHILDAVVMIKQYGIDMKQCNNDGFSGQMLFDSLI